MKLLHYSKGPIQFDPARTYIGAGAGKPLGFWVSVEGDDDWKHWCEGENFGLGNLACPHEVKLKPDANVLVLDDPRKLDEFNTRFGSGDKYDLRALNWSEVQSLYDGLIIAPYSWKHRLDLMWYYTWDCASGVIWNLSAVASVTPHSAAHGGTK